MWDQTRSAAGRLPLMVIIQLMSVFNNIVNLSTQKRMKVILILLYPLDAKNHNKVGV